MSIAFISHPACLRHQMGEGHPERPERLSAIEETLLASRLDRSVVRIAPLEVRYRGFDCPESFVVGYGLDVDERWRNLPVILTIEDPDALATDPDLLLPFLRAGWEVGETADGDSVAGPEGAR